MKHLLIIILFATTTLLLQAQEDQPEFQSEEVEAGKNLVTNENIKGTRFIFQKNITDYDIDTTANLLTIKISKAWLASVGYDSKFLVYDTNKKDIIWTRKYNAMNEDVIPHEGFIIYSKKKKAYNLDLYSGDEKWEVKYQLYLSDFLNKVGMGYPNPFFNLLPADPTPDLKGFDLTTGKTIWERTVPRRYGWDYIRFKTDSTLFIVAEGLHYINIRNGMGWEISDLSTTTFNSHNHSSPVLMDSLQSYWASGSKLWCVNNEGGINWTVQLDPALTGKSYLFKQDSSIYLINPGYVHGLYNYPVSYGKPYIAQFSDWNGQQQNFMLLNVKKQHFQDHLFKKDTMYVCFPKKLVKYNIRNFTVIKEREFKSKSNEKFELFTGSRVFKQKEDQTYVSLTKSDSTTIFLLNKGNNIVGFNSNFDQVSSQKLSDFLVHDKKTKC